MEQKEISLYRVATRDCGTFYVVAQSFDHAAGEVSKELELQDYGYSYAREITNIEVLCHQRFLGNGRRDLSDSSCHLMVVNNTSFSANEEVNAPDTTEPSDNEQGPVAIDLGLPSGTLWCDRNVGARSPEDSGAYFSWGNTEPHYPKSGDNDWGDVDNAIGYSFDEETYKKTPGAELTGDIDLQHDAARVNMGSPWKMPTREQFEELFESCTVTRKNVGGVNGLVLTSKINGKTIFFPASGSYGGTSLYNRGSIGYYWSSRWVSTALAYYLYFYSGNVYPASDSRGYGFALRAVQ